MRIIQITDSHIELETKSRLQDLKDCVAAVNAEKPDIVIHTGDITHTSLIDEYNAARDVLDQLTAPYFVLAGNKDKRKVLRKAFSDHNYLMQNDQFIQYSLEQYSTRLIMLDTVRESDSKGEFCIQRLENLRSMLAAESTMTETARQTIIFMHHSPYRVEEIPDPQQFHNWNEVESLGALISEYPQIQQIYCGHVHRNVSGQLAGVTDRVAVEVLSCMATDLRKGKLSESDQQRPMFRVIDLPDK